MKRSRNHKLSLILAIAIPLGTGAGLFAQDEGGPWVPEKPGKGPSWGRTPGAAAGGARSGGAAKETVEARIKRQRHRIESALQQGTITKDKAMQLKSGLDDLEAKIAAQKQANGGKLKQEQIVQTENSLNQSNEIIRSFEGAGSKVVDNGKVLGPTWSPGKDGAQNSKQLLKNMKSENRREQRQYKQAMEQTLEQQQLDYEKQTMQKFQKQRNGILEKQGDLKQVRKDSGAN